MPFTFSHPAIILPLKYLPKKWFSLTGLIIGSLTPDFEYFIRMKVSSIYSHTIHGIFWFDLPLAILITFLFHNVIRNNLYLNLPNTLRTRLLVNNYFHWNNYFSKNWPIVIISTLIGISSHILWDSFTHQHGYFVEHFSILNEDLLIQKNKIPIWKIAQHFSTILGAIFIILSFSKLPKHIVTKHSLSNKYWFYIFSITLLILILRFLFNFNQATFGNIIVTAIGAFIISLILTPILIKQPRSIKI